MNAEEASSSLPESSAELARSSRTTWPRLAVLILILLAVGSAAVWRVAVGAGYHFAAVQDGILYRSGNNSLRRLKTAINSAHIHTVVAMIDDKELASPLKPQFKEEFDYLGTQGIKLDRVPVRLGGWPTSDDVQHFLRTVADPANRPVLVHCAQGVRRTGMFVAAYEESVLGYDKERAKAAIQGFGHSERTIRDVEKFIDLYDPKTQTIDSAPMPLGEEK